MFELIVFVLLPLSFAIRWYLRQGEVKVMCLYITLNNSLFTMKGGLQDIKVRLSK